MLYILKTWYTMLPTLPVLFCDFAFLALGVYAATAIKSRRYLALTALGLVLLYLICTPVSLTDVLGIGAYATFLGAVASLVLVGFLVGAIARRLRKKPSNR